MVSGFWFVFAFAFVLLLFSFVSIFFLLIFSSSNILCYTGLLSGRVGIHAHPVLTSRF